MIKNKLDKVLMAAFLGSLAALGASLVDQQVAHAQGSATVGSLRGLIRDRSTGEPAVGATVVATSPALQGEQVVITDETGQYFITSLAPGIYALTVYYNEATFSRSNVLIQLGKEAVVNVTVDSATTDGKPKGEVIEIAGAAPIVDQGSTKTGVTFTDDYTRNIPTSRTFGGTVGAAAGAQGDFYGISLSGATSAENVYIVEGINTTDTGFGGISSNLPNEFIAETEVITGGYNAEFGRATGGIINVVTKQGSNEFHGSVFGYFRPGAFVSDAREIQREGGSITTATNLDYQYDLGAEMGGPIIKDKLWFHVGLNPSFTNRTTTRIIQRQVDADNDGIPDENPATGFTLREELARSNIPRELQTYFFTAKINGAIDQNNQFQISAFGNPSSRDDLLAHSGPVNRNPAQTRWHVDEGAYDVAGKWTSKFNKGRTQIDAVAGYHHGFTNESPLGGQLGVRDEPFVFYNFQRSLYDFRDLEGEANVAGCQDSTDPSIDPYPRIRNCPVFDYATGGLSFLEQRTNARTSGAIALTHRARLGPTGYHVFKAGGDIEYATYDATHRYTGAQRWRRSANTAAGAPGRWQLREFYRFVRNLNPNETPANVMLEEGQEFCANDLAICERADQTQANTLNRNIGAFVQDSWQVRPNLTLNLGLRYEQQVGFVAKHLQGRLSPEGEVVPESAYTLHNWAPRIGFIYDPTREGRSKIFGHYGQFYENVPMDLNVRAFGGEILNFQIVNFNRRRPGQGGYDPNCDVDHTPGQTSSELVARLSQCQDRLHQAILGGGYEYVSPGLRGQRTDEIILGAEYEVLPDTAVGFNYIRRTMPVVIEDISVDGGNTYLITNPGFDFSDQAAKLERDAQQLMMSSDPRERALGDLYQNRADQLNYVKNFQKPVRDYDALQLLARQRPTRNSLLLATYTYSHTRGNYPGLFSTETLQLDPNLTSLYDLPELMGNRYGRLGHDRPHNLKVDGFYLFDLQKSGQIVAGGSWRSQSGVPSNALGAHPIYGDSESYLLPRGSAPRSPVTHQLDVRLAYGYVLNKSTRIEAFVNIFNLFNQQDQLAVDEEYTPDAAQPIMGGRMEDLQHLKAIDLATGQELNQTVFKNRNFAQPLVRTAPRNVQLGFRLTF
jgi:outer membrane receptor protein involved in Fe transport